MKILLKDDPVFEKAHRVYESFTVDDRLVELLEARMKRIRDEASLIEGARIEGREEGEQKVLLNLQKKGYSTKQIAEMTGIEEADVTGLISHSTILWDQPKIDIYHGHLSCLLLRVSGLDRGEREPEEPIS